MDGLIQIDFEQSAFQMKLCVKPNIDDQLDGSECSILLL